MFCGVSLLSLTTVAFNRYIFVCKSHKYNQLCSKKIIIGLIITSWLFAAIVYALPPWFGWSRYALDAKTQECVFDRTASESYNYFACTSILLIPSVVCGYCYFRIFQTLRANKLALQRHKTGNANEQKSGWISSRDVKVVVMMFIVLVAFAICWTPFSLLVLIDGYTDAAPDTVYLTVAWLTMINSCINSWIYGVADKNFRQGYKKIFFILFRRNPRRINTFPLQSATYRSNEQSINSVVIKG